MSTEVATTKDTLTPEEAAEFIGSTPGTLSTWRCTGKGPVYVKSGRSVRYLRVDLEAYQQQNRVDPTAKRDTPAIVEEERERRRSRRQHT
jgi:hypothetical protein